MVSLFLWKYDRVSFSFLVALLLLLPHRLVLAAEKESLRDINTILMETTFKIQGQDSMGTAFLLGRPYPQNATMGWHTLVTAAHVLEAMKGEQAVLIMRRKLGSTTWERLPIPLRIRHNGKPLSTKHPQVDVAVMYISVPNEASVDMLPTTMLADDKVLAELEIHPGDELNCLGYPFGAEANDAGFPILRSGKIASYPLIPTKQTRTFLFDFRIFASNSGGPVYWESPGFRRFTRAPRIRGGPWILGLVTSQISVTEKIKELYAEREQSYPLGIAEVVHASWIKEAIELLPSPETLPH